MGTLYLVVNDVPEVGHCTHYKKNCMYAQEVMRYDPFAVVFLLDEQGVWYKGDYCFTDRRHKFLRVGMAAVPELILMMRLVKS